MIKKTALKEMDFENKLKTIVRYVNSLETDLKY